MKKLFAAALMIAAGSSAMAQNNVGCGWGSAVFNGQRGVAPQVLAATTNGTSGNATFGMTSGTNGCSTNGTLTYGGKPMLVVSNMLDELSEDMAKGQGEALTTYAVVLGVAPQDRAHFNAAAHAHFNEIFTSASVSAADVHAATLAMMHKDARLAKYAEEA